MNVAQEIRNMTGGSEERILVGGGFVANKIVGLWGQNKGIDKQICARGLRGTKMELNADGLPGAKIELNADGLL